MKLEAAEKPTPRSAWRHDPTRSQRSHSEPISFSLIMKELEQPDVARLLPIDSGDSIIKTHERLESRPVQENRKPLKPLTLLAKTAFLF